MARTHRERAITTSHFAEGVQGAHSAMEGPSGPVATEGIAPLDREFACELHDEELFEEIRLLGDLVLAASKVTGHLTEDEVDQILMRPRPPEADDAVDGARQMPKTRSALH